MSKAADAFRTISEVADEIGIPKHVLRFWEGKFPQVRPMKRGGGRRFYRPEDLELLRGICQLLHNEGYTIKGVQKILRRDGVEAVKQLGGVVPGTAAQSKTLPPMEIAAPASKGKTPGRQRVVRGRAVQAPIEREPLSPAAKKAIRAAIDELASLRALLLADRAAPAALRGAA